jgi:hypothetical protein
VSPNHVILKLAAYSCRGQCLGASSIIQSRDADVLSTRVTLLQANELREVDHHDGRIKQQTRLCALSVCGTIVEGGSEALTSFAVNDEVFGLIPLNDSHLRNGAVLPLIAVEYFMLGKSHRDGNGAGSSEEITSAAFIQM